MSQKLLGSCLVCGATAVGINFAVPTCAPCKAFFRRNAVKLGRIDFICQQDGDCPVTYKSRRMCNCCRLAKCFRVGMQKSLIRSDAEKLARKELIQQNRQKRTQLQIRKHIDLIRPPTLLRLTHNQSRCLSPSDQALLTNIVSAYERTYIATLNKQYLYFPSKLHTVLHTLYNEYSDRHLSLIEYFKLIPEFTRLTINDRARLIQNHFGTMFSINESRSLPRDYETIVINLKNLYGVEIAMNICRVAWLLQAYGHDPILLKLLLIVRSLSSSINRYFPDIDMDCIYDNTQIIFASQNIYVELLWTYILSRLPSERDAVKFFNKLIRDLLHTMRVGFMIDNFMYNLPDEIDQMSPLMQNMWPRSKHINDINSGKISIKHTCDKYNESNYE